MEPIKEVIVNKNTDIKPIWFMRQAGRYLPEFRAIRAKNTNFIELCLNKNLVPEITLQPLKRFNLDAAIVFSDILMLPYGIGQEVEFKKDFGPLLGSINDIDLNNLKYADFTNRLKPVYESLQNLSNVIKGQNKSLIGFVGAPWTLLVYMLNKKSPKKNLSGEFKNFKNKDKLIQIVIEYLKLHIKNQINSGSTIIQIFDSWAGLANQNEIDHFIYEPTAELVKYVKSLNTPVICFPRDIKDYNQYIKKVNPDAVNIDYNIDIKKAVKDLDIPIQGGLDPKILLGDKDDLKREVKKILINFKNHPYIFNLGHGVLPQTNPDTVSYLINLVREH